MHSTFKLAQSGNPVIKRPVCSSSTENVNEASMWKRLPCPDTSLLLFQGWKDGAKKVSK